MKTTISKIIIMVLMLGYTYTLSAHVELDYPQGGETFTVGQTVTIQWHIAIPHNTLNWDLLFSADGGVTWEYIYQDLPPGQLSYQWIVPSTITTQARVSVIQDNSDTDYQDESMNFTIQEAPIPPIIVLEANDISIGCNINSQGTAIQGWLDNHGGATATGNCGDLLWSNDFISLSNDCGASGSALVTFTATDGCGSTETSATLNVIDNESPVIQSAATDVVVECDGNGNSGALNTWRSSHGGASAVDDCSEVQWTDNFAGLSNDCGSTGLVTVTFIASDECGNTASTFASFSIVDTAAPVISAIARDTIIDCGTPFTQSALQNWLDNHGGGRAIDECGSVSWTNDFPGFTDTCTATTTWSVSFTAIDECGNNTTTGSLLTLMGTSGTSSPYPVDFAIHISPNPVHQVLKVDFENNESLLVHLTLFDAFGHRVLSRQAKTEEIAIPVSGYTPGLYYLYAETSYGVYTQKVLID